MNLRNFKGDKEDKDKMKNFNDNNKAKTQDEEEILKEERHTDLNNSSLSAMINSSYDPTTKNKIQ